MTASDPAVSAVLVEVSPYPLPPESLTYTSKRSTIWEVGVVGCVIVTPVVSSSIATDPEVSDLIDAILKVAALNSFLVIILQVVAATALLTTLIVAVVDKAEQETSSF